MNDGLTLRATCGEPFDHVWHLFRAPLPTGGHAREWTVCDGQIPEPCDGLPLDRTTCPDRAAHM